MAQGNTRLARRLLWTAGTINGLMLFTACCGAPLAASSTVEGAGASAGGIVMLLLLSLGFGVFALVYASSSGLWFEMSMERTWKKVCAGIKFNAKARSYRNGVYGAYARGDTKTIYPKLRDVHGTPDNWTGMITAFGGQDPSDYAKYADKFAFAFRVRSVTFEAAADGRIRIRAGRVPIPAMYRIEE